MQSKLHVDKIHIVAVLRMIIIFFYLLNIILGTYLTKVPCSMRLDISAGDTSMKRRKEKQFPASSPGLVDKANV